MIPCQAVAAPAAARRSTLLAEALASRLAEQGSVPSAADQRFGYPTVAAAPIPRTAAAPPEPLAVTTAGRRMAAHPVSTLIATPR